MSRTDVHRPVWVQCNDSRREVAVWHSYRCDQTGGTVCDLPAWPVDKHHLDTRCSYFPDGELGRRVYANIYATTSNRRVYRRAWFSSERTALRAVLRSLTRDAMRGGEVDEGVIENRQTKRYAIYGGGRWD